MKAYEFPQNPTGLDGVRQVERPDPKPGPYDVLVRLRACALNYRDHAIITGRGNRFVNRRRNCRRQMLSAQPTPGFTTAA